MCPKFASVARNLFLSLLDEADIFLFVLSSYSSYKLL